MNGTTSSERVADVLIIGGGPAGLAAALTLARQQHVTIVLDSKVYRNAPSPHMHNVLTWDREAPGDFRAAARKNILDYYETVEFQDVEINSLVKEENGTFVATDNDGKTWIGRKVILAEGVHDIFPDIAGYSDCWAKAIFHCFFCKGYEARGGKSAAVLALPDLHTPDMSLHFARIAKRFAPSITIYTHGSVELGEAIVKAQGNNFHFKTDSRRIVRFEKSPHKADVIIHFEDGSTATESFIGHRPPTRLKSNLAKQLGCNLTAGGDLVVSPGYYETSVRGVFAGGDDASPLKIVPHALFSGSAAGAAACVQLQADDVGQKAIF